MSGMVVTLLIFVMACTGCISQDQCGPNEVHRTCGSACPPTCQNPFPFGTSCIAVCKNGCFCKFGYLRDEISKACVPILQCPRTST